MCCSYLENWRSILTLQDFFSLHPKIAIAFSGGADSAYLLYAACRYASEVKAYYVKSEFQPGFELEDARRLSSLLNADMAVLDLSVLSSPGITSNPADRCYHCKSSIFSAITEAARADGFPVLADGTNASDDIRDRPGMRILEELSVLSPLRQCALTKSEIRRLSREAGLFTWNKPAYACLATRIPTGETITPEKLQATEKAEDFLSSLGFSDFRIRWYDGNARLQLPEAGMELLMKKRSEVFCELKKYYKNVFLDLEVRE